MMGGRRIHKLDVLLCGLLLLCSRGLKERDSSAFHVSLLDYA